MGAGQLNKVKVGFIIQARMNSSRLPNKVLMNIPPGSGKPIIQWIADELKKSKFAGKTIIATSVNSENDPIVEYCRSNNIGCFRGDEENVLSRFFEIEKKEHFDVIVRLTGDNPIVDVSILDMTIQFHLENNYDYTKTEGLPLGMNFEIVSSSAILDMQNQVLSNNDKEHVTLFIKNNDFYKKGVYIPVSNSSVSGLRLTIDYPSDLQVVSALLSLVNKNNEKEFGLPLVEKAFKESPWIFEGNSDNIQKTV